MLDYAKWGPPLPLASSGVGLLTGSLVLTPTPAGPCYTPKTHPQPTPNPSAVHRSTIRASTLNLKPTLGWLAWLTRLSHDFLNSVTNWKKCIIDFQNQSGVPSFFYIMIPSELYSWFNLEHAGFFITTIKIYRNFLMGQKGSTYIGFMSDLDVSEKCFMSVFRRGFVR